MKGPGPGALWTIWAAALVGVLWYRAAGRAPARSVVLALVLTAGLGGAAFAAQALRSRLTVRRAGTATAALLLGAAAASGELRSWLGAAAVLALAAGPGLLAAQLSAAPGQPVLLALALGLAALALLGLATTVAGGFSLWAVVAVSAAAWGLLAALPRRPAPAPPDPAPPPPPGRAELAIVGLLGALLGTLVIQASVPDCCFDPVWAHLPLTEAIAERRHAPVPAVWWTMTPHAYHGLAAIAYAAAGGMAAKLLHSLFLVLNLGWSLWLGARLRDRRAGVAAAALFLTIPLVMWDGTVGNTDMAVVFFVTAAVAALLRFLETGGHASLFAAGALVGTAVAIKYLAAAVLFPLVLVLLVEAIRRRRPALLARGLLLLAAGVATTAAPWLLRTALLTGNPVFPTFNAYFHSPYWPTDSGWEGLAPRVLTPGELLGLPFLLTFDAARLGEVPRGGMGTFPLLWLPVLVARWPLIRREERYLLLIAAGTFAPVLYFSTNPRYQLVSWFLLAVVLGGALTAGGSREAAAGRPGRIVLATVLVCGLGYSILAWTAFFPAWASLDYLGGKIDRQGFFRRTVPAFDTFEEVRRVVPPDEPILADSLYTTWYAKRYLVPAWLPVVKPLFANPDLSREQALARLRALGIRYFLALSGRDHRLLHLGIARPVLRHEGFTLYELTGP